MNRVWVKYVSSSYYKYSSILYTRHIFKTKWHKMLENKETEKNILANPNQREKKNSWTLSTLRIQGTKH